MEEKMTRIRQTVNRNPKRLALELLTGATILAIIIGVLYPAFARAPIGPNRSPCLSNLKQLAISIFMYQADEDDAVPPYFTFDGRDKVDHFVAATRLYTKNKAVYSCPQDSAPDSLSQEGVAGKMTYVHCFMFIAYR